MNKKEIILVGGGGHCHSVIDVIEKGGEYTIAGIVDMPEKLDTAVLGYKIKYTDADLSMLAKTFNYFCITIGQIKSPAARIKAYLRLKELQVNLPVIISPGASVSGHSVIGEGTVVMGQAFVNAGARIGVNCIINTRALLEHDVVVGDYCHISTNAVLNGDVTIGDQSFIGSSTIVNNSLSIAGKSIIGSGAVITKNLVAGTYFGNPARLHTK